MSHAVNVWDLLSAIQVEAVHATAEQHSLVPEELAAELLPLLTDPDTPVAVADPADTPAIVRLVEPAPQTLPIIIPQRVSDET